MRTAPAAASSTAFSLPAVSWRQVRGFVAGAALSALLAFPLIATADPAFAQRGRKAVPVEELMKPQALPDVASGPSDAPVTIVEYASVTCPHCADFHKRVFPSLKSKYIDCLLYTSPSPRD